MSIRLRQLLAQLVVTTQYIATNPSTTGGLAGMHSHTITARIRESLHWSITI